MTDNCNTHPMLHTFIENFFFFFFFFFADTIFLFKDIRTSSTFLKDSEEVTDFDAAITASTC